MVVKDKIKALREALEQHNYNYYVLSAPTISDREFDEMMKELQVLEESHPEYADPHSPTQRVGSDLSKEFEQVVHKYPMLSLGNTYSEDEVKDFYERIARDLPVALLGEQWANDGVIRYDVRWQPRKMADAFSFQGGGISYRIYQQSAA